MRLLRKFFQVEQLLSHGLWWAAIWTVQRALV
jgi:hypothetical protein